VEDGQRRPPDGEAVLGAVDAERLSEPRRAGGQKARLKHPPTSDHAADAVLWLKSTKQNPSPHPLFLRGNVGAEVHAVGEVDVQMPRRPEQNRIAIGPASVAVTTGVILAIRLGLDDAPPNASEEKGAANQVARDLERVAGEEGLRERLTRRRPAGGRPGGRIARCGLVASCNECS